MDLFNLTIITVAISVIISWALFAIICSLVQEAVAQFMAERGRFMKKYLYQQLDDESNGLNWAAALYMNGTIDLLSRAPNKPTNDISPALFAQSIVEVVGKAHLVQMQLNNKSGNASGLTPPLNTPLDQFRAAVQVLHPSDVVSFFRQALNTAESIAPVKSEPDIYRLLIANLEAWYVQMTERLTLWYKRTRQRLFLLGAVLGFLFNVDSIQLFKHFNENEAARNAMIGYYEANAQRLQDLAGKIEKDSVDARQELKEVTGQVSQLRKTASLPVGWDANALHGCGGDVSFWLFKILGVLISGFAASFGAPFWFDVLKRSYSKSSK